MNELTKSQAATARIFVASPTAMLNVFDESGEVVLTEGLNKGSYEASEWADYMLPTDFIKVSGGAHILQRQNVRVARMPYGAGSHETGANPDFRPTSADRAQRALAHTMQKLQAKSDKQERMLNRLTREKSETDAKEAAIADALAKDALAKEAADKAAAEAAAAEAAASEVVE